MRRLKTSCSAIGLLWLLLALPSMAQSLPSGFDFVERRDLGDGIAEYLYELRLGAGDYDVIGLHRVVRERRTGVPEKRLPGLFMVHGDIWGFSAAFFSAPNAIAPYLARHGVDVWGIDLRWTRVPATETDFAFMRDWGMEQNAADVDAGLAAARAVRTRTGSGPKGLFLLGWSRGGQIGYAVVNQDSQRPPGLRQVRGFIPVDIYLKSNDPSIVTDACTRRDNAQATFDAGVSEDGSGALVALVGDLAELDPSGPSPILLGLSNLEGALLFGSATYVIIPGGVPPVPFYHFTGGTFDPVTGVPQGLIYTPEPVWTSFLRIGAPFEPLRLLLDSDLAVCDQDDVSFDDHLGDVDIPVLYVGAGGGFGEFGVFSTSLLGSRDVSSLVVSTTADRPFDFGHGDLFLADEAETLVWRPILEWIQSR